MLFLSGCQLCSNCLYTLPRAIKEKKKKKEGVGHSGGLRGEKKVEEGRRRDVCFDVLIWLTVWRLKGGEEAFFFFLFFWVAESSQGTRVDLPCFIFEGSQESKKKKGSG